jgi:type I restriction enzyme S subunit
MTWQSAQLKDLVFFQRGFDITKAEQKSGSVPVISSSGITSYHDEAKVAGPGIVIGRKGTLGSVHFSAEDFWPHDTTLWSKDLRSNDPKFVYYFLKTLRLEKYNVGNANPTLNRNHIHGLDIRIPPVVTQVKIGEVLSGYDALIENNRRRIQLLEESARLLYREWFVHFRFPGHERVRVTDGVPLGWQQVGFSSLAKFQNGYPFAPDDLHLEGLPIVKIPELKNGVTAKTPRNHGQDVGQHLHLDDGDLVFSWSGTLHVDIWRHGPALLNQHLFVVVPTAHVGRSYLLNAIQEAMPAFMNQATGATMKHIRKAALDTVTTLLPSEDIAQSFEKIASNIHSMILVLVKQTVKLNEARDLLLPKLMSGEVQV